MAHFSQNCKLYIANTFPTRFLLIFRAKTTLRDKNCRRAPPRRAAAAPQNHSPLLSTREQLSLEFDLFTRAHTIQTSRKPAHLLLHPLTMQTPKAPNAAPRFSHFMIELSLHCFS